VQECDFESSGTVGQAIFMPRRGRFGPEQRVDNLRNNLLLRKFAILRALPLVFDPLKRVSTQPGMAICIMNPYKSDNPELIKDNFHRKSKN
jgi:hypothetical protein